MGETRRQTQRWPSRHAGDGPTEPSPSRSGSCKSGRFAEAAEIYDHMMTSPDFAEFLTMVAYDYID